MHVATRHNDQLLLQHPSVGTNNLITIIDVVLRAPTVRNKLLYSNHNAL